METTRNALKAWANHSSSNIDANVIKLFKKLSTNAPANYNPSPAALVVVDVFIAVFELRNKSVSGPSPLFREKAQVQMARTLSIVLATIIESYKVIYIALDFAWGGDDKGVYAITNDLSVVTKAIKGSLSKVSSAFAAWNSIQGENAKMKRAARRSYTVKLISAEIDNLNIFVSSIPSQSRIMIAASGPLGSEDNVEIPDVEHDVELDFELVESGDEADIVPDLGPDKTSSKNDSRVIKKKDSSLFQRVFLCGTTDHTDGDGLCGNTRIAEEEKQRKTELRKQKVELPKQNAFPSSVGFKAKDSFIFNSTTPSDTDSVKSFSTEEKIASSNEEKFSPNVSEEADSRDDFTDRLPARTVDTLTTASHKTDRAVALDTRTVDTSTTAPLKFVTTTRVFETESPDVKDEEKGIEQGPRRSAMSNKNGRAKGKGTGKLFGWGKRKNKPPKAIRREEDKATKAN